MTKAKKHGALGIRGKAVAATLAVNASTGPSSSSTASVTPTSSAYASAYPSEDESQKFTKRALPFRFMALPSELRNKIYSMLFSSVPAVLDLDPSTFSLLHRSRALALFTVSRQVYEEAVHNFFSTHTFRIFPTYPGRYFKTKRPLLARLPKRYRASIVSLQLRLGPGWNNPPRGWVVNDALGLTDCVNVRVLKVFVECDPSDAIFQGFRAGDGFYERFSARLLDEILKETPSIQTVEFDAYTSVKRTGDMMSGLREVVARHDKLVGWGPERGWKDEIDQVWLDAVLLHVGPSRKIVRSVAVIA